MRKRNLSLEQGIVCPKLLAAGNESAFEALYHQHHYTVYSACFSLSRCPDTSHELVQEVFLKLWLSRHKLAEVEDIASYLFCMSRNMTINHIRRYKRRALRQKVYLRNINQVMTCRYILEEKEFFQFVWDGIAALPPRQQEIFLLKSGLGWEREKIACKLNIAPNTVKATIQNAYRNLRVHLSTRCYE